MFIESVGRELWLCYNCGKIHLSKQEATGCKIVNDKWIRRYLSLPIIKRNVNK